MSVEKYGRVPGDATSGASALVGILTVSAAASSIDVGPVVCQATTAQLLEEHRFRHKMMVRQASLKA
jgi:hypothetical protein